MNFDTNKYRPNSLFVLSNDYYIDITEVENGNVILQVKTPEGALWSESTPIDKATAYNPLALKTLVNSTITEITPELGVEEIIIIEILQKQVPPAPKTNSIIKVFGKVVDENGRPISNANVVPTFIELPPPFTIPPPSEEGAGYTDFTTTTFALGSALILSPVKSDDDGDFEIIVNSEEGIDFENSYIVVGKEQYTSKQVGPKFIKKGEEVINYSPNSSTTYFEGPVITVAQNLNQLANGNYRASITVKDPTTGTEAIGVGESISRETAKKIANNDALTKLASAIPPPPEGINPDEFKENTIIDLYPLGKVIINSLRLTKEDLEPLKLQAYKDLQSIETDLIVKALKPNLSLEARTTLVLSQKKEELKRRAIPYVLILISRFGPNIVNKILGGERDIRDGLVCIPEEDLKDVINKRNQLTRTINNAYKVVRTIAKILNISRAFIFGLKTGLAIAQALSAAPPG